MAENKKSFVLYCDLIHTVKKMSKTKRGELFMTILEYVNDENPIIADVVVDLVFEPIKQQLKRDLVKWEEKRGIRAEAGRKGGLAKASKAKQRQAKDSKGKQNVANLAVNVNDTVNDNVTVNEEDKNIYTLSKLLFSLIKERNPNHKEPNFDTWSEHLRLMIKVDKRSLQEIEGAIRWSQQDSFWQNNILSTTKLRKQFDTIYLKAKGEKDGKSGKSGGASESELTELYTKLAEEERKQGESL